MAEVTLAEFDGQLFLVGGEEHIDAVLCNELPPGTTVELLRCATRAELHGHWTRLTPDTDGSAQPWVLNPLITRRLLTATGLSNGAVRFSPWSAMVDADGQAAINQAAEWLGANPAGTLVLRQFAAADAPPGLADLQRLRGQLVSAALARAGSAPARPASGKKPAREARRTASGWTWSRKPVPHRKPRVPDALTGRRAGHRGPLPFRLPPPVPVPR